MTLFRVRPRAIRIGGALATLIVFAASSGWAVSGDAAPTPPRETPPPRTDPAAQPEHPAESEAPVERAQAEKQYAKGFEEAEEAKKELAAGKADSAKKKFGKALKKFDEATKLDPGYYQAWNMVGYCARKTGDMKRAFAAYEKCLAIEPDYAEAHEYLGEAYVMVGDIAKAKEQLHWLRSRNSDEAEELAEKIEAASPGSAASGPGTDSTAAAK